MSSWPPSGKDTHRSRASMAARTGLSKSTIGGIWKKFDFKPHLQDSFKLAADPFFVEKVVYVAGLDHNLPEKAVVLCVDEKSQFQAYLGGDPGACDGGQEPDMTHSCSVADVLSGVGSLQTRRL